LLCFGTASSPPIGDEMVTIASPPAVYLLQAALSKRGSINSILGAQTFLRSQSQANCASIEQTKAALGTQALGSEIPRVILKFVRFLSAHQWQALLLLFILGCLSVPVMRYLLWWDVSVIASVWVAGGTLALAVVTWWNVYQTKAVVAGEDRRHQQSFLPIVEYMFFDTSEVQNGFIHLVASNIGSGPALDIRARLQGSATIRFGVPTQTGIEDQDHNYAFDQLKFERSAGAPHISPNDSFVVTAADFHLTRYARGTLLPGTISVTSAEISYADVFGNRYKTIYDDFRSRKYHLEQPENLRVSGASK